MKRDRIVFDYDKCTGCGVCARGCGKQVIEMVNGKPQFESDRLCDGLGICVPLCRFGAISVEKVDTEPYDPQAVREYRMRKNA